MANKTLFQTIVGGLIPATNTVNSQQALAQYAATGCFNRTFYATAGEQLDRVLELCDAAGPEFVARVAVYSRHNADPALGSSGPEVFGYGAEAPGAVVFLVGPYDFAGECSREYMVMQVRLLLPGSNSGISRQFLSPGRAVCGECQGELHRRVSPADLSPQVFAAQSGTA